MTMDGSDTHGNRPSELRLRAAVESSPSGLLMIDKDGRIILVNREIERLFGYAREEILGKPVDILVPQQYRQHQPQDRERFFATPKVRSMGAGRDLFGVRKDGTEVPVEIGLTPVVTDEGVFVISSIVDISARRIAEREHQHLEEQLRQSQKLEAIGRLAGGIAHDFNNVLAAIVGYAELAQVEVGRPQLLSDLDEVLRAANRGKEVVERILRFSRRQEIALVPIDLTEAAREASRLLRVALPPDIDIELSLSGGSRRAMGDATSIQQVLMNLSNNAAQAMPDGGKLHIGIMTFYASDSFVRAHPGLHEGHYHQLQVRDTGTGMDDNTRARAFEPFFTTKPVGKGTGLGLSMVHGIVSAMSGITWLESEPGKGTSVYCLLPALETSEEESVGPDVEVKRGTGQHIMFVDDDAALARVGERRLIHLGYRATSVNSPAKALEEFLANPDSFSLVITDYSMPQMRGVELARAIHKARPEIPIVLLTGYMEDFPPDDMEMSGIRRVLKKPITVEALASVIQEVLVLGNEPE